MICPNCKAQLPDNTAQCYSCKMIFYQQQTPYPQNGVGQSYTQNSRQNFQQNPYWQQQYQQSYQQQSQYKPQQQNPYQPQQPQYQPQSPPPQKSGGKTGLIIALIAAMAVLVGLVLLVFVFDVFGLMNRGSKETAQNTSTTTRATTEEKTTEATTESTTEAITEATTEEPIANPYGAEQKYVFSDSMVEVTYENVYCGFLDENMEPIDIDASEYINYNSATASIDHITRSEPDQNGMVTYLLDYSLYRYSEFNSVPDLENYYWYCGGFLFDVTDYYTGTVFETAFVDPGTEIRPNLYTVNYADKSWDISICTLLTSYDYDANNLGNGFFSAAYKNRYLSFVTVPEDYDGLVLSIPKEFNKKSRDEISDSAEYGVPVLDQKGYGYTGNADDAVFVRVSDNPATLTPQLTAEIFSQEKNDDYSKFDWFNHEISNGNTGMDLIGDKVSDIYDAEYISGEWDGYIFWDPEGKLDSTAEEYFNGHVDVDHSTIIFTLDYQMKHELYSSGENWRDVSAEEDGYYFGEMMDDGSISFDTEGLLFHIDKIKTDGYYQYMFGTFILQDGTEGKVLMQRP